MFFSLCITACSEAIRCSWGHHNLKKTDIESLRNPTLLPRFSLSLLPPEISAGPKVIMCVSRICRVAVVLFDRWEESHTHFEGCDSKHKRQEKVIPVWNEGDLSCKKQRKYHPHSCFSCFIKDSSCWISWRMLWWLTMKPDFSDVQKYTVMEVFK